MHEIRDETGVVANLTFDHEAIPVKKQMCVYAPSHLFA